MSMIIIVVFADQVVNFQMPCPEPVRENPTQGKTQQTANTTAPMAQRLSTDSQVTFAKMFSTKILPFPDPISFLHQRLIS